MRIVSYNIHKGIGGRDRRYRLDRILKVLDEIDPDIICLQEVDRHVRRSRFDDQSRLLQHHFGGVGFDFQLTLRLGTGGYGNLVLSRWPLHETVQISLNRLASRPRGAQIVVVDSPHNRFLLVNLHLSLFHHEREWQMRRLLEHHDFLRYRHLPTIILGDTNDWRNRLIRGPMHIHQFRLVTEPVRMFRSFPAWWPLQSLDKAFYRGNVRPVASQIWKSETAQEASDHLPLVIDFSISEMSRGEEG